MKLTKQKLFYLFLFAEAIFCILFYSAQMTLTGIFSTLLAFPFEQSGLLLRLLSLSGFAGNIAAILLYCMISLIPAVFLFHFYKKDRLHPEDALLAVLTVLLFFVLYFMVNPGYMSSTFGNLTGSAGKAFLGGAVYSILAGYVVLRLLRLSFAAGTGKLRQYLKVLLYIFIALFLFFICGSCFGSLLESWKTLYAENVGYESALGTSCFFLILQYLVNVLPYILDILVAFGGIRLLDELAEDPYAKTAVLAAERLSRLCGLSLTAAVLCNIIFNLLQLLFAGSLHVINGTVSFPLLSVGFVLTALLLTRYLDENRRLKADNDLFI